jgi:hypothetical protein
MLDDIVVRINPQHALNTVFGGMLKRDAVKSNLDRPDLQASFVLDMLASNQKTTGHADFSVVRLISPTFRTSQRTSSLTATLTSNCSRTAQSILGSFRFTARNAPRSKLSTAA